MGRFEDLIEQGRNPGDDGLPETWYDDLYGAHSEELSIRDAKINETSEAHAAALAEVEALKAKNWDLQSLIPPQDGDSGENSSNDDVVEVGGIDSLFENPVN